MTNKRLQIYKYFISITTLKRKQNNPPFMYVQYPCVHILGIFISFIFVGLRSSTKYIHIHIFLTLVNEPDCF